MDVHIFYKGHVYQVEWYVSLSGKMKAKEYFDNLPEDVKKKLTAMARFVANEEQLPWPPELFKKVDKKQGIWEFRPKRYRFFNFFYGNGKIIITNGCMKQSQKAKQEDLETARRRKKEYEGRGKG